MSNKEEMTSQAVGAWGLWIQESCNQYENSYRHRTFGHQQRGYPSGNTYWNINGETIHQEKT